MKYLAPPRKLSLALILAHQKSPPDGVMVEGSALIKAESRPCRKVLAKKSITAR